MNIDKLDLLSKGWNVSEIEKASKILEEKEGDLNQGRVQFVDGLRIAVLAALMLANGFVCSNLLVPFIFAIPNDFILVIASVIGFIFSMLFTVVIYDYDKIHHRHETKLFIAFIVSGIVNVYLLLEFIAQFSVKTKLPVTHNIYVIAGTYLISFLIPQVIYQMQKKHEI